MREKPLILLVDDEEVFLEIASTKLRSKGLETVLADGVPDALRKAVELLPDLVLSDIYMPPGPTGWDFALELRSNPRTQDIKIAFFTSLRDPWTEYSGDRKKTGEILRDTIFLNKADGVDTLADRVVGLIEKKSI